MRDDRTPKTRGRRRTGRSEPIKKITKKSLIEGAKEVEGFKYRRPKERSECQGIGRPCPFVSCKYNLFLDVTEIGTIKFNFSDIEELKFNCVLDWAELGGITLDKIGDLMLITRERVRQTEEKALQRFRVATEGNEFFEEYRKENENDQDKN